MRAWAARGPRTYLHHVTRLGHRRLCRRAFSEPTALDCLGQVLWAFGEVGEGSCVSYSALVGVGMGTQTLRLSFGASCLWPQKLLRVPPGPSSSSHAFYSAQALGWPLHAQGLGIAAVSRPGKNTQIRDQGVPSWRCQSHPGKRVGVPSQGQQNGWVILGCWSTRPGLRSLFRLLFQTWCHLKGRCQQDPPGRVGHS